MLHTFHTFQSGEGDCITFRMKEGDQCFNMLVDCGELTDDIEDYVLNTFDKHIHLLVITHIDNDHILGVKELLTTFPDIEIDGIIYNCGQETALGKVETLPDSLKNEIDNVKMEVMKATEPVDDVEVSAKSALTLAEVILSNDKWKAAWMKHKSFITNATADLLLDDGRFGKLSFLSPTKELLCKLDDDLRLKYNELFRQRMPDNVENSEMLCELLSRVLELERPPELEGQEVSDTELTETELKRLAKKGTSKISDSNKSSLAFLWSKGEHSIFFFGDADPRIVTSSLKQKELYKENPLIVDAIKVSHHGSRHNTSAKFLDAVDSTHYFITGGSTNESMPRPNLEAMARIILQKKPKGIEKRILHFNFSNNTFAQLMDAVDLQQGLGFEVKGTLNEDNVYEFQD